ncbi:MAG: four-carbon acid sugar kinase family protein [Erysipelotrichales bacterium]
MSTLIVADDTTGANASGILLQKIGLKVFNQLKDVELKHSCDVVTVGTSSRAIESSLAYQKVIGALTKFEDYRFSVYNKRVDSTLRGNIGPELDAYFDYFKGQRKCIIVPSFPDSGRICNSGDLYVNDMLLENTEVAKDPKMPITSSNVKTLFEKNSKLKYDFFSISKLKNGNTNFRNEVSKVLEDCDALIIDAITNDDIDFIARNIVELGIDVICVDPGPFTQKVSSYNIIKSKLEQSNLFIIGSVVDTALMQLNYVNQLSNFDIIYVDASRFFEEDTSTFVEELMVKLNNSNKKNIVFATLDINNPQRLDLNAYAKKLNCSIDEVSDIINYGLARFANVALKDANKRIKNIYVSGGDVSIAFLNESKAEGLSLVHEILPLSVHSIIVGGINEGLNIITKGGTIGGTNTLEEIASYMEEI